MMSQDKASLDSGTKNDAQDFFKRAAFAWQNYFNTRGLFPNIQPTSEQITVINQVETQMLINGSAGSGKSVMLLYKLIRAMEQQDEHVHILFVSYNPTLIEDARKRLKTSQKYCDLLKKGKLIPDIVTFHKLAWNILREIGIKNLPSIYPSFEKMDKMKHDLLAKVMVIQENYMNSSAYKTLDKNEKLYLTQDQDFLIDEFWWMKANGIVEKEKYLEVERSGRGNVPRLTKDQRKTVFTLYERYNSFIKERHVLDPEDYALLLLKHLDEIPEDNKYDYIYADEIQDLAPMQLKALAQLTKKSLTLAGDARQRIYKRSPLSYQSLGIDLHGRRSRTLKKNFRSTEQIMKLAGSLKFSDLTVLDENELTYNRQGDRPEIRYFKENKSLSRFLVDQISAIKKDHREASIAIVHQYSIKELQSGPYVKAALDRSYSLISVNQYGVKFSHSQLVKPIVFTDPYSIKGLEFDYVFILNFDETHYPMKSSIEELDNHSDKDKSSESYMKDLESIIDQNKKLLYVALTRARQKVWMLFFGMTPAKISPFVQDFNSRDYQAVNFRKKDIELISSQK